MDYDTFIEGLLYYYQLYDNGLKKQANKYIADYVHTISAWDKQKLNGILFQFVQELCDEKEYDFLKRGNSRLPYALDIVLRDYLYSECLKNMMPQLRWFYELYRDDKNDCMYAKDMLERAYSSSERDEKTVELLFDSWLDVLGWGAHHFPDGCIITKETMRNAVEKCKKIICENEVDEKLKEELRYYELLYQCYYKYKNEGERRSFQEYCSEANISFYE